MGQTFPAGLCQEHGLSLEFLRTCPLCLWHSPSLFLAKSLFQLSRLHQSEGRSIFPGQEHFQGQLLHAASYRFPEAFRDQRVLVVGAGNSAVQIAVELAQVAQVTLTSRQPVRFLPQRPWGRDVHFWMWLLGIDRLAWPSLWQRRKSNPALDTGRYQTAIASSRPNWRPLFTRLTPEGAMWSDGPPPFVHTLILATGYQFQPDYLSALAVFDDHGQVSHRRGSSLHVPGLFFVGLSYQRTYASATLRGVGPDAAIVVRQIQRRLNLAGEQAGSSFSLLKATLLLTTIEREAILTSIPLLPATVLTEREEIDGTATNHRRLVTRGRPLTYATPAQLCRLLWWDHHHAVYGPDRIGTQQSSDLSHIESAHRL
ncbi:MAG TPA: hypothetical protein VFV38_19470 [Ktedonobacteraceae bacterium]|nr:hypothetical protein [Ktedonobacteraceae bacterium]